MAGIRSSRQGSSERPVEPNAKFIDFMRRLVAVPHSEIKAKLDAEKKAKRTFKASSRVSVSSSKRAT
jgi:hypothetical protein